ncbi:MAG: response regulator [Candidatus Lambdaproteobacteria bacterium]|nr:response regulator [Candidatus Lambdaproteobacteria bacterium]
MGAVLRALFVTDSQADLEAVLGALRGGGFDVEWQRVAAPAALRAALAAGPWGIVFSDCHLPALDGEAALRLLRESGSAAPAIVLCDEIGQERAVALIRAGAAEVVRKGALGPLAQAVTRCVRDAAELQERRRAEEQRLRLAHAIEQAAEAIALTDAGRTITYVNAAFEALTGYGRADAVGRPLDVLAPAADADAPALAIWEQVAGGVPWRGPGTIRRKDGSIRAVRRALSPIRDARGAVSAYLALMHDAPGETEPERRLLQAQRMEAIGAFAGGVGHDFNNILTPILGYAEMAQGLFAAGSEGHNYLASVRRAAVRARELIAQMLLLSRRRSGVRTLVKLGPLAEEVLNAIRPKLAANTRIVLKAAPELAPLLGNTAQLRTALASLCEYGAGSMPEGGELQVALENVEPDSAGFEGIQPGDDRAGAGERLQGPYVHLSVRDTGAGMDQATTARIFDPFFSTREPQRGKGLGLALVYGIVAQHDGFIAVESAPGRGTTFHVHLPARAPAVAASAAAPETARDGGAHVLFVDDEEDIAALAKRSLERLNYRVTTFSSSTAALADFRKNHATYDVIVSDATMPELSGAALALQARELRPGIPLVLISGYANALKPETLAELDVSEPLTKPFSREDLARAIRAALARAKGRTPPQAEQVPPGAGPAPAAPAAPSTPAGHPAAGARTDRFAMNWGDQVEILIQGEEPLDEADKRHLLALFARASREAKPMRVMCHEPVLADLRRAGFDRFLALTLTR